MADFDKLWDYNDPAATEAKFREVLANSSAERDLSCHLQLLTQMARTFSLRARYAEAHELLDTVEKQLTGTNDIAHIGYYLERGRTYNSSGKKAEAKENFDKAKAVSEALKDDGYTIDAIHMLAIVAQPTPDLAARLNEEAILLAENSTNERAKGWLGSLYNNLAWSYFDKGEYEKALSIFLRALKWYEQKQRPYETFVAKWTVARTLRAQNEIDKAITIQLALFEEMTTTGKGDGYVHEELGELYLIKGDKEKAPFHFQKAYEMLSKDVFLPNDEPARLERIKGLAKGVAI